MVMDLLQVRDVGRIGNPSNVVGRVINPSESVAQIGSPSDDDNSRNAIPTYKILQSLKRHTARQANKLLRRSGTFWQDESYDHVVRDENELERIIWYVLMVRSQQPAESRIGKFLGEMAMDLLQVRDVGRIGNPSNVVGRIGNPTYTGTHINYYFVCHRKLWLFAHGIGMEHTSDTVLLGKLIDESSYERKDKGIDIDGAIVIDWLDDKTGIIHEVKKSDKMEVAHQWQVLYYLWYLKQKGVNNLKGEIDYPKLKQKAYVELTPEREAELMKIIEQVGAVIHQERPPDRINKRFCKTCSYFELCWTNQ